MFFKKKKAIRDSTNPYFIHPLAENVILTDQGEENLILLSESSKFVNSNVQICGSNNVFDFENCNLLDTNIEIHGSNNRIEIIGADIITSVKIFMRGNGHCLKIGKCKILGGVIWFETNDCRIYIEDFTTIERAGLIAVEPNNQITVGEDCMISHNVTIRTSDSHPIYDLNSNIRINESKDVKIGDHVWIGAFSNILKGVSIGKNSAVGISSTVTKNVPENCVVVGQPAKVIRENIYWTREPIREPGDEMKLQENIKLKYFKE